MEPLLQTKPVTQRLRLGHSLVGAKCTATGVFRALSTLKATFSVALQAEFITTFSL
jgi:hypothetical protein